MFIITSQFRDPEGKILFHIEGNDDRDEAIQTANWLIDECDHDKAWVSESPDVYVATRIERNKYWNLMWYKHE